MNSARFLPLALVLALALLAQAKTAAAETAPVVEPAIPAVAAPATPASAVVASFLPDLTRQLSEHYKAAGELKVELIRAWVTPSDASGPVTVTLLEAPAVMNSNMLVRVHFQSGEKSLGETSLLMRSQLMREVWVSRAPMLRNQVFDPTQLDTRVIDALRERDTLAITDGDGELTFTRPIPAGQVLTWHDVVKRALVRKGDVIDVAAVDGSLSINLKALAMENGAAGETVRVRNLESKKEFTALVVGQAKAQIRL